ncbi:MAG TPA: hypothetical protein VFV73_25700 [Streptosporangiaceae bacterium]|nr:hypothetical protein [Streptosporangiaceae bacterium]
MSSSTARSEMTLLLVPAWMLPTVSTAVPPGGVSRETIACSRTTIIAASTTGFTVACGIEPWPPRVPTCPAGAGRMCWAKATPGAGMILAR